MDHFSEQDWVDFLRQLSQAEKSQEMQAHLQAGCPECKESFRVWEQMSGFAAKEGSYIPPENLVRLVKLEFAAADQAAQAENFSLADLVFNSSAQPLPAGIRSGAAGMQQLVYEKEGLNVHLSFARRQNSSMIFATGQVLDKHAPLAWLSNATVVLWSSQGKVINIVEANGYGEFQLEFEPQDQMRISIAAEGRKTLRIPLVNLE
jgi:hypothetical protein